MCVLTCLVYNKMMMMMMMMTAFSLAGIEPMRFCTVMKTYFPIFRNPTTFECHQCLRLSAGIKSCRRNAPNVFNRRQIWRILRLFFLRNVTSNVSTRWLGPLMCVHEHCPADNIHITTARKQLCRSSVGNSRCTTEYFCKRSPSFLSISLT